jgi:hypothetical protein
LVRHVQGTKERAIKRLDSLSPTNGSLMLAGLAPIEELAHGLRLTFAQPAEVRNASATPKQI